MHFVKMTKAIEDVMDESRIILRFLLGRSQLSIDAWTAFSFIDIFFPLVSQKYTLFSILDVNRGELVNHCKKSKASQSQEKGFPRRSTTRVLFVLLLLACVC